MLQSQTRHFRIYSLRLEYAEESEERNFSGATRLQYMAVILKADFNSETETSKQKEKKK